MSDKLWTVPVVALFFYFIGLQAHWYRKMKTWLGQVEAKPENLDGVKDSNPLAKVTLRQVRKAGPGSRPSLAVPAQEIVETWFSKETSKAWFLSGAQVITGGGLALTFMVIMRLMTSLGETLGQSSENVQAALGSNVQQIGAKFLISAVTAGLAAIYALGTSYSRKRLLVYAKGATQSLDGAYLPPWEADAERQRQFYDIQSQLLQKQLDSLGETGAIAQEVGRARLLATGEARQLRELLDIQSRRADELGKQNTRDVVEALGKLSNIDVTLQSLGKEVQDAVTKMLNDSLKEQFEVLLKGLSVEIGKLSDNVQAGVSEGLAKSMGGILEGIQQKLEAGFDSIRKAIEAQSSGNLEQLLGKLGSVAGTEVRAETAQLNSTLGTLKTTIERMEKALESFSVTTMQGTQHQQAQSAQVTSEMVAVVRDAVGRMQEGLDAQLLKTSTAMEVMAVSLDGLAVQAAQRTQAAEEFSRNTAVASTAAMSSSVQLFQERTEGALDQTLQILNAALQPLVDGLSGTSDKLRGSLSVMETSMGAMAVQARGVTETFKQGSSDMQRSLGPLLKDLNLAVDAAGRASSASTEVQGQLANTANLVGRNLTAHGSAVTETARLLVQVRETMAAVEGTFPKLLGDYAERSSRLMVSTLESSERTMKGLQTVAESLVNGLDRKAAALTDAVSELQDVLKPKPAQSAPLPR